MADTGSIEFQRLNQGEILAHDGDIALFADSGGNLHPSAGLIDRACGGAASRAAASETFKKLQPGESVRLSYPAGLQAETLLVVKLDRASKSREARKAGGVIARQSSGKSMLVLCQGIRRSEDLAFGAELRAYRFDQHKSPDTDKNGPADFRFCVSRPEQAEARYAPLRPAAAGVRFARDLVNEPANVLTTDEFVSRLLPLKDDGVEVDILREADLEEIGMRALLAVGQGSQSPSYVGIMRWRGGEGDPLVVAGKGVVFDTGGISLKPALKMEQMTMDMAGAATVAGVMRSVARRRARANVVGIVGLVENMPGSRAQRPGDVVRSLKGDTVEVINTDAEGRLVLADLLWHAQSEFSPCGIIDLATLTGAIIVGLGTEFAGAFSNHDKFCREFLAAARDTGERAWRMPLDDAYDKLLKSRIADMKNVGGRDAGAITAAQFLQRFVKPDTPWIHLDIAGVASLDSESDLAPPGATGWGVRAIDQLIRSKLETA